MESASFEDAQRDASLHAVDVGLNASVAAKATLGNGAPHERYTHGTEHYRLSKEAAIQRETQREKELEDERREARKRSELEAKRRAKAQREKEEREKAIREAIQRHRRIVFLQQKGLEEAALFSQWALGKENSKVLGRQVQALWQVRRPICRPAHPCNSNSALCSTHGRQKDRCKRGRDWFRTPREQFSSGGQAVV